MKSPVLVCIVGPSCAGKSTAAGILTKKTGFTIFPASKYPRERYLKSGSKLSLLQFVEREFQKEGKGTFATELVADLARDLVDRSNQGYIIDGFRAIEEIDLLKKRVAPSNVLGIFADARTRFLRNLRRNGKDAIQEYTTFVQKDLVEYGFGMAEIIARFANCLVINEEDMSSFEVELSKAGSECGFID